MSTKSQHSVRIEIPKPRKIFVKLFERSLKREKKNMQKKYVSLKHSNSMSRKCALPEIQPLSAAHLKRTDILLPYKYYLKKQEHEKRRENFNSNIFEKYKNLSIDLKKRCYVHSPSNEIRTVTDFDKDYFTNIKHERICKYTHHYKSLKYMLNDQSRLKQDISFRKDSIFNIEINYRNEVKTYDLALKKYKDVVKNFDNFIAKDYQKSMAYLSQCDEIARKVNEKVQELQNSAMENFTMMSTLLNLEYMYGLQLKYGRFLYYLSSPTWRLENRQFARSVDIETKGFDFGISNEKDNFDTIYEKIRNNCYNNYTKPVLYFSQAGDLIKIFDDIKKRQLHIFNYIFQLQPFIKLLQERIIELKQLMKQDTDSVASTIEKFNSLLLFNEERCSQLEMKFFKVLNESFYDDVGAFHVLKLKSCLDFCYEKVYSERPLNLEMITIAKTLENSYFNYCSRIDVIRNVTIRNAIQRCEEVEKKKLQRAYEANQELQIFNRLQKHLTRAFEPKYDSKNKLSLLPIVFRNEKTKKRSEKIKSVAELNRRSLTEAEREYLCLFTDWTEHEDPAVYLKSLSFSKD